MAKRRAAKRTTKATPQQRESQAASGAARKPTQTRKRPSPAAAPSARRPRTSSQPDFPIVCIGASAGGLEAMVELLGNMPPDSGMAFVVVTHQHPGHTSMLPELLGKETDMPVVEAASGEKAEPNHVYVAPSGGHLAILGGRLQRMETGKEASPKLPIDYFLRSLAEDQKEQAICIILSGTGADGTLGLRAVKSESGMAMVERPESARYAGMPSSAIATGLADYVLPPADMPAQLVAYARGPYLHGAAAESPAVSAEPMQKIFAILRSRTGNDFSAYKSSTLRRRIERRMNVHQIERPNQYVRYLQENPHEVDLLFKELLISVTHFFRDPQAWEALAAPLEELIQSRPESHVFRVWAPGCATGEEAFSLAIALRECMEKTSRHLDTQVFGTDLDSDAIETARVGRYPGGIAVDVSPPRLDRHFLRDDAAYRVRKEIREMAIFAPQNVIKDPPFTKLDMISCRNLLIYLSADLQKKLLPIFHYSLRPGGLLFLGPSETIGSFLELFEPVDKKWKIFRRREFATAANSLPDFPAQPLTGDEGGRGWTAATPPVRETRVSAQIERLLLSRFAPASVVVDERGDIVYIHGRTGMYLEPSEGQPRSNILEMAREGLQLELAAAIRQSAAQDGEVVREDVRVRTNGEFLHARLSVTKLMEPQGVRGLLLVTLQPVALSAAEPAAKRKSRPKKSDSGERIERLERELQYMKQSHQTTREELETSNEELKSTNEELQSTNEELQSANEELETSKEEMQSLNEELSTVNAELQSKLDDLSQANDDMQNLLNSTDIATVFLDNELNIKRFTEQAKELVMLRPTDIGRPISELASNLKHKDLAADCREVLKTLVFHESEVRTKDGGWHLMRLMPYRTTANVIDGLVVTFVDIQQLKEAERAGETRAMFESIVDTVRAPLLVLDSEFRVASANRCFCEAFHLRPNKVVGAPIAEIGDGAWNIPQLNELLEAILPADTTIESFELDHEFPHIGRRVLLLNARRLERDMGLPGMILLAMEDVTESRKG